MNSDTEILEFYFGKIGAWIPLLVMLSFISCVTMMNQMSLLLFSEGALLAVMAAVLLAKDKMKLEKTIINGIQNRTLSTIVMAFILAGVLSQLLRQSGLIDGLIWGILVFRINPAWLPVITFGVCTLISAACGTTNGAIAAVTPVLLPMATAMGCDAAIIMGAIMSGAILGHNIAPVCDTSIVSAITQEAEVADIVRTRLPYAVFAGLIAAVAFGIQGFQMAGERPAGMETISGSPATLIMLAVPVFMIGLMLKGNQLIRTLLLCDMLGIAINLVFGFVSMEDMFSGSGPVAMGLSDMTGIILFCILLFIVLEVVEQSGIFIYLADTIIRICRSKCQAETAIAGISILGIFAIGADVPAIAAMGPFVRKLTRAFGIKATRGANIMDGLQTAFCGMIPYNPGFMIGISMAAASGCVVENFSFREVLPYCYYSITMVLLILLSIFMKPVSLRSLKD